MSFKKGFVAVALLCVALMVFGGCGGGGGDSPSGNKTGKFIDGPVQGLKYGTKETNAAGEFGYKEGDATITFAVGGIELEPVKPGDVVTPLDYYPGSTVDSPDVLELVCFIMDAGTVDPATGNIAIGANPYPLRTGVKYKDVVVAMRTAGEIKTTHAAAKTHVSKSLLEAYAGNYTGTWSGSGFSGNWKMTVAKSGAIIGTFTQTSPSIPGEGTLIGSINADGTSSISASGQAGAAAWAAKFVLGTGKVDGTWKNEYSTPKTEGTFTGARGTAPAPDPVVGKLDGTWKIATITYYSGETPSEVVPQTRTPETFPVKVFASGNYYTIDVNNGGYAYAKYEYNEGGKSGMTSAKLPTLDKWKKVGEQYEYEYAGTNVDNKEVKGKITVKLTGADEAVYIDDYITITDNNKHSIFKTTLTRVK